MRTNDCPAHTIQHIEYAKTKSWATLKRENPDFVPPTSVHAQNTAARLGNGVSALGDKRSRDERMDDDAREAKRERTDDDSDAEEMEIDDEEDTANRGKTSGVWLPSCRYPSC